MDGGPLGAAAALKLARPFIGKILYESANTFTAPPCA